MKSSGTGGGSSGPARGDWPSRQSTGGTISSEWDELGGRPTWQEALERARARECRGEGQGRQAEQVQRRLTALTTEGLADGAYNGRGRGISCSSGPQGRSKTRGRSTWIHGHLITWGLAQVHGCRLTSMTFSLFGSSDKMAGQRQISQFGGLWTLIIPQPWQSGSLPMGHTIITGSPIKPP